MVGYGGEAVSVLAACEVVDYLGSWSLRATLPCGCSWLPPGGCALPWVSPLPPVPRELLGSGVSEGRRESWNKKLKHHLPEPSCPFLKAEKEDVCFLKVPGVPFVSFPSSVTPYSEFL